MSAVVLNMQDCWNSLADTCNCMNKTRWNSTGCRRRLCLRLLWPLPLTFWLENLISVSRDPGNPWPDFDEISTNSYEDIVFTWFFRALPAVTLTFDLLTPKSNQHFCETQYVYDQNWVKLKIWCWQRFLWRTDSLTDWHTRKQNASAPVFGVGGIQPCVVVKHTSYAVVTCEIKPLK